MSWLYSYMLLLCALCSSNCNVEIKGLTSKQLRDLEDKAMEDCRVKLGTDKNMIDEFLKPETKVPNTQEFKEWISCLEETMGYTSGNKRNMDKIRLAEEILNQDNPQMQKIGLKIWDDCSINMPEGMDLLESAYYLSNCTKEAAQKVYTILSILEIIRGWNKLVKRYEGSQLMFNLKTEKSSQIEELLKKIHIFKNN